MHEWLWDVLDVGMILYVCGIGNIIKKTRVREFINVNFLDFVVILETKFTDVLASLVFSLWVILFVTRTISLPRVIMEVHSLFSVALLFRLRFSMCFSWVGASNTQCFVVTLYLKCSLPDKIEMWEDILLQNKRRLMGDVWCVLGGFNDVWSAS